MNNKLSNPLFFAMMFFSVFQVNANSFANVTLTCSTEKFPVKGGFKFINSQKVERYNILLNHKTNKEFIKKTEHCYSLSDHFIAISDESLENGCGGYSSFIDINTLEFSRPIENIVLTAQCFYSEKDLMRVLKKAINN